MSITADVDRGLVIRKELEALTAELKDIQARLIAAGLARPEQHVDLVDEDREGKQYAAKGTSQMVPVIFTADVIMGSFGNRTLKHDNIEAALPRPELLKQFFKPPTSWENKFDSGKKFRALAADLLGKDAPAFITACVARDKDGIPKSAIKVEWDRAKEVLS